MEQNGQLHRPFGISGEERANKVFGVIGVFRNCDPDESEFRFKRDDSDHKYSLIFSSQIVVDHEVEVMSSI
jgi:hypothetical protein